jgi:hypothetical protein
MVESRRLSTGSWTETQALCLTRMAMTMAIGAVRHEYVRSGMVLLRCASGKQCRKKGGVSQRCRVSGDRRLAVSGEASGGDYARQLRCAGDLLIESAGVER